MSNCKVSLGHVTRLTNQKQADPFITRQSAAINTQEKGKFLIKKLSYFLTTHFVMKNVFFYQTDMKTSKNTI